MADCNEMIESLERSLKELCEKKDEISHETIKQMYDKNLASNAPPSEYYEICDRITNITLKLSNLYSQNEEISHLQETALFMEEYSVKPINAQIEMFKKIEQLSGDKVKIGSINDVVAFLREKRNYFIKEIDNIYKKIMELFLGVETL